MQHIDKFWGYEQILETNENYTMKLLFMKAGHKCSLQYHEKKHESIFVVEGKLKFYTSDNINNPLTEQILNPKDYYIIPPGLIHRMEGIEDSLYIECSTSFLLDVVRIEDEYGRV